MTTRRNKQPHENVSDNHINWRQSKGLLHEPISDNESLQGGFKWLPSDVTRDVCALSWRTQYLDLHVSPNNLWWRRLSLLMTEKLLNSGIQFILPFLDQCLTTPYGCLGHHPPSLHSLGTDKTLKLSLSLQQIRISELHSCTLTDNTRLSSWRLYILMTNNRESQHGWLAQIKLEEKIESAS